MLLTDEFVFASEAHAIAAATQIDSNAGFSSPETWDIPRNYGSVWVIGVPLEPSWYDGIENVVRTQPVGSAKIYLLTEDYTVDGETFTNILVDTDGLTELIDYMDEGS